MLFFSGNKITRTIIIHRSVNCMKSFHRELIKGCGCGDCGKNGNQKWWCENHFSKNKADIFMNNKQWAMLLCERCFSTSLE